MNNWYFLAAIPVFGLLVIGHELGHFLTAKWAGIRVEEFGLGLPPRIVGIRKRDAGGWEVVWFRDRRAETAYDDLAQNPLTGVSGGVSRAVSPTEHTLYSLNWLPIGGFVRMPGETGEMYDEEGRYDPGSFAAKSAGKRVIVLVAGVVMNVILALVLFSFAYGVGLPHFRPVVASVTPNTPAAAAGLRAGDTFITVNQRPVQSFEDVQTFVQQAIDLDKGQHPTVPVQVVFKHQGETTPITRTINVRVNPPPGQGAMGISRTNQMYYETASWWQAPIKGVQVTFSTTHDFIVVIGQMISGAVKPKVSGPIGIVNITGQVAQSVPEFGWGQILSLTAILSLNLAIVNILPFPALDGGRIVLILIELLRGGKRLKPEREGLINLIGMACLLTLIAVISIGDIINWGNPFK